ncbi:hypothetical protein ACFE04_022580 [Oxalis oulophora]
MVWRLKKVPQVFKRHLQEYAHKFCISTRVYETTKRGPSHEPFFMSTVIVNDIRELTKSYQIHQTNTQPLHETCLCKNLLHEYSEKLNYDKFGSLKIVSKDPAQNSNTRARAALLIIISSVIAPGPTENYVHIKHLPLVQNLDEVHLYSWGATYLASVHGALSSQHKKLCCSLFPIYGSLFLHFPWHKEFFNVYKDVAMNFPLCVNWFKENDTIVWDHTSNMKSPLRDECLQMGQAIVLLICHEYIHYHMPFESPSHFNLNADEINVEACDELHGRDVPQDEEHVVPGGSKKRPTNVVQR